MAGDGNKGGRGVTVKRPAKKGQAPSEAEKAEKAEKDRHLPRQKRTGTFQSFGTSCRSALRDCSR